MVCGDFASVTNGTTVSFDAICETENGMIQLYALMGKRLIFVPKEPSITIGPLPEKPELCCNKRLLDTDQAYKVAGFGVVAGEEAYKKLNDGNTILSWE